MKAIFQEKPIKASVVSCILVLLICPIVRSLFGFMGIAQLYLDGLLRIAFTIPAVVLLGFVVNRNGFKYVFSMKGTKNALFASLAMLLYILTPAIHLLNISEMNVEFKPYILPIVFLNSLSAVYEEVLCRGLLMTAMLIKFGGTAKGRLFVAFVSSIAFGLGHISGGMWVFLLTAIGGLGFSSVYIYSGNLVVPMLIHAFWNILIKISDGLIAEIRSQTLLEAVQTVQYVVYILIPIFAIIICIKAKSFFYKIWPEVQ